MRICCEICDNVAAITIKDWMDHLLSGMHQDKSLKGLFLWPEELNNRSLVVTCRPNANGEFGELRQSFLLAAWYFSKYGIVSDACVHPSRKFYIIQLEKREYARKALAFDSCVLEGVPIVLRLKSDLSPGDWFKLSSCSNSSSNLSIQKEKPTEQDVVDDCCLIKLSWLTEETKNMDPDVQLQKFMEVLTMSESDFSVREELRLKISLIVRQMYSQAKVFGMGDVITGLGNADSTLQLCLNLLGTSQGDETNDQDTKIEKGVENVYNLIAKASMSYDRILYRDIEVISGNGNSMPCIKFTHHPTNIRIELHFDFLRSVQRSKLVKFMISLDERVLPLMLMVRYWTEYNIRPYKSINHYTLELLVIVFLNVYHILPNVAFLQSKSNPEIPLVEGFWNVNFCSDFELISEIILKETSGKTAVLPVQSSVLTGKPSAFSMFIMVKEFFDFYARIDFNRNLMCSLVANVFLKSDLDPDNDKSNLHPLLLPYKVWSISKAGDNRLPFNDPLCVQDPFYHGKNVASDVSADALKSFQDACCKSGANIQQLLNKTEGRVQDFLDFVNRKQPYFINFVNTEIVVDKNHKDDNHDFNFKVPEPKITKTIVGKRKSVPWSQSKPAATVVSNPGIDINESEDNQQVDQQNERFTRRVVINANEMLPPTLINPVPDSRKNNIANQPLSMFEKPEKILRNAQNAGPSHSKNFKKSFNKHRHIQDLMSMKISVHQPYGINNSRKTSVNARLAMMASSSGRTIVRNTETGTSFGTIHNLTVTSPLSVGEGIEDDDTQLHLNPNIQVHRIPIPMSAGAHTVNSSFKPIRRKRGRRGGGSGKRALKRQRSLAGLL